MSWQDSRVSCAKCGVAEVTPIKILPNNILKSYPGTFYVFSLYYLNMEARPPSIQGYHNGFKRGDGKKRCPKNFLPKQQDGGCEGRSHHHPQLPHELHLLPLWQADLQPGVELAWNDSNTPCCQSYGHWRYPWLQSAGLSGSIRWYDILSTVYRSCHWMRKQPAPISALWPDSRWRWRGSLENMLSYISFLQVTILLIDQIK